MQLNKRQKKIIRPMDDTGPKVCLCQSFLNSAAWKLEGHWPRNRKANLMVMDVHRMMMAGLLVKREWGTRPVFYRPR